jgi:hypothetical protein
LESQNDEDDNLDGLNKKNLISGLQNSTYGKSAKTGEEGEES